MSSLIVEYGSVFAASMLRLFVGAGLSLAYGHHPIEFWLLTTSGSIVGVSLCLFLGTKLQSFWSQRTGKTAQQASSHRSPASPLLVMRIWQQYGLWGLALAGIWVGTIPSVAIALVSGMSKTRIFLFLTGGKIAWATLIALMGKVPF